MTEIFSGTGLGVHNSSLYRITNNVSKNQTGPVNQGLSIYLNAMSGNLVVRQADGFLAHVGIDMNLCSTYNAQGTRGQKWSTSTQTHLIFQNETNAAPPVIIRIAEDGHQSRFYFDHMTHCYYPEEESTEQIIATSNGWSYRENAAAKLIEYNKEGQLLAYTDLDGHQLRCFYMDGQLSDIIDTSGKQKIHWQFHNGFVQDIHFLSNSQTIHQIHFEYDGQGRLIRRSQSQNEGDIFWTNYTYLDDSELIASITQSTGFSLSFSYDAEQRITCIQDGEHRSTVLHYDAGKTWVSNGKEAVCYSYDRQGHLVSIDSPSQVRIRYEYEGNYLSRVIQGTLIWYFRYNNVGDCVWTQSPEGECVERIFNSNHQILQENYSYLFKESQSPKKHVSQYYIYDPHGHLRFQIDKAGVVTELRYNEDGLCQSRRVFLAHHFLTKETRVTLDQLESWTESQPLGQVALKEYRYDWRGQLLEEIVYQRINSSGEGEKQSAISTYFQYDARKRLLAQTKYQEGKELAQHYTYDDLDRLLTVANSDGLVTRYEYDDAHQRQIEINASGLETISIFDKTGILLCKQTIGQQIQQGIESFFYDEAGRLVSQSDFDGRKSYFFYHETGLLQAKIDPQGRITEYRYDDEGRIVQSIALAQAIHLFNLESATQFAELNPIYSAQDRHSWYVYNQFNQIAYSIDASGSALGYRYNERGLLCEKIAYAHRVPLSALVNDFSYDHLMIPEGAQDRHCYFFYDAAQHLTAEVDSGGGVTEYGYDLRGNCVEICRHFKPLLLNGLSIDERAIAENKSAKDIYQFFRFNNADLKIAEIDGEGYVIGFEYNALGQLIVKHEYTTPLPPINLAEFILPVSSMRDHISTYSYNARELLQQETHSNGLRIDYRYNEMGLLIEKKSIDLHSGQERENYIRYDQLGHIIASLDAFQVDRIKKEKIVDEELELLWQTKASHYQYDQIGRLISKTDALQQKTHYIYNNLGQLSYQINPAGEVIANTYDVFGQVIETRHLNEHVTNVPEVLARPQLEAYLATLMSSADDIAHYDYNILGQLSTVEHRKEKKTHSYNAFHELIETVENPRQQHQLITSFAYDQRGQLLEKTQIGGGVKHSHTWGYDSFGRVEYERINQHLHNQFQYNRRGECIVIYNAEHNDKRQEYDAFGRILSETDFNNHQPITRYEYDEQNNSFTILYPISGKRIVTQYNAFNEKISFIDAKNNTTEWEYDAKGQLVTEKNAIGNLTHYVYDELGRLIIEEQEGGVVCRYRYDPMNHMLSKTVDPDGLELTTQYQYDGQGRQIKLIEANGLCRLFTYDDEGQLSKISIDPDGLNLQTTFVYDEIGHLIQQIKINKEGPDYVIHYEWDAFGRCIEQVIDPEHLALTTHYEYNENGQLIRETDARGNKNYYVYDALNQCRFHVNAMGVVTEQQYDKNGHNIATITYAQTIDLSSPPDEKTMVAIINKTPASDQCLFRHYDSEGRLVQSFDALGYATGYSYDLNGNIIRITQYAKPALLSNLKEGKFLLPDSHGARVVHMTYDACNRLHYQINQLGYVTEFHYDCCGNVIKKTLYANNLDVFGFSLTETNVGEQLLKNEQEDSCSYYSYDKAGRLEAEMSPEGIVKAYRYNFLGKCVQTIIYANKLEEENRLFPNWVNKIKTSVHDRMTQSIYDKLGREIYRISPEGRAVGKKYDGCDNLIAEIKYDGFFSVSIGLNQEAQGQIKSYQYDAAGRLISCGEENQLKQFEYDSNGNVTKEIDLNHHAWMYEYDASNRLKTSYSPQLLVSDCTTGQLQTVRRCIITQQKYDSFGNLIERVKDEQGLAQRQQYLYDANNRCVKVIYPQMAIDNSSSSSSVLRQEIRKDLVEEFRYDAFGQVIAQSNRKGQWQYFLYNCLGQLCYHLERDGSLVQYQYNYLGQMASKCAYAEQISLASNLNPNIFLIDELRKTSKQDRHEDYLYDKDGRLCQIAKDKVNSFDATKRQYQQLSPCTVNEYNNFGEIIQIKVRRHENLEAVTKHFYDKDGLLIAIIDAEGYLTSYDYNAEGLIIQETQYRNRFQSSFEFFTKPAATSEDRSFTYTYNRLGQLISKTQHGMTYHQIKNRQLEFISGDISTYYEYDGLGQLTKTTDALGNSIAHQYNALGQLIATRGVRTNSGQALSVYGYDGLGHLVSTVAYANSAGLDSFIAPSSPADRHSYQIYNEFDELISEINDDAGFLQFSYDELGNISRKWQEVKQIDGSKRLLDKRFHYDAFGRQIEIHTFKADGSIACENQQFNTFGELISKGSNGQFYRHYDYDLLGRVWRSNENGYYQIYVYDLLSNVTQVVSSTNSFTPAFDEIGVDLSLPEFDETISFQDDVWFVNLQRQNNIYDGLGYLTEQYQETASFEAPNLLKNRKQLYLRDRWGNIIQHINALGQETRYTYNNFNQLIEQILPEVNISNEHGQKSLVKPVQIFAYDGLGRRIAVIDANHHQTLTMLNALGEVEEEIDAKGFVKRKAYDLWGRLIQLINEKGAKTYYCYDRANRLVAIRNELSNQEYGYDEVGQMLYEKNAPDESKLFIYDELGHAVARRNEQGFWQRYLYDDLGHKLKEINELGATQTWEYNLAGQVNRHVDLGGHVTVYQYNQNNLLLSENSSAGRNIKHHYYADGNLKQYVDEARGEVIHYEYNDEGGMVTKQSSRAGQGFEHWNLESDYYEYDDLGRLTAVKRQRPEDHDLVVTDKEKTLFAIEYEYDAVGNLMHSAIKANFSGYAATQRDEYFSYDENNRVIFNKGQLVNEQIYLSAEQGSLLYYDSAGNIIRASKYEHGSLVDYEYGYNNLNQHIWTKKNHHLLQSKYYDLAGRVVEERSFNAQGNISQISRSAYQFGLLQSFKTFQVIGQAEYNLSHHLYYYDGAGNLIAESEALMPRANDLGKIITHQYSYLSWDSYLQSTDRIRVQLSEHESISGCSQRVYDVNGLLQDVLDEQVNLQGVNHSHHYWISAQEGVRARRDQDGLTNYISIAHKTIADVQIKNNGEQLLTVYGGFTPQGELQKELPNSPQEGMGTYAVQIGDSLESIAFQVYGDSSLWYVLADANGLNNKNAIAGDSSDLHVGKDLILPPIFKGQHQNNNTHVRLANDYFLGNTSATVVEPLSLVRLFPPQNKRQSSLLAKIASTMVTITAGLLAAAAVASVYGLAVAPGFTGILKTGAAVLSGGVLPFGGTVLSGFASGVASHLAGYEMSQLSGSSSHVDWGSLLFAGLATAASAGMGWAFRQTQLGRNAIAALNNYSPKEFNLATATGMGAEDLVNQSLALAVRQQNNIDWRRLGLSTATAGVLGGASAEKVTSVLHSIDRESGILSETITGLMTVKADSLLRGQHYHAVDVLEGRVGQIVGQGLMNEFTKTEQPSSNEPVTLDFIGDLAEEERKYEAFMQFISEFEEGDKNISKPETGQKSLKFNPFIQFSNQLFPGSCYVDLGDHDNHLETEQSPHEEVRINGSPSKVAIGLSLTLDFVPILGQLKAAREVWTGMDPITEQKTNRLLSAAMLIPGGKVATMTGKWLTKTKPVIAAMQWMGERQSVKYSMGLLKAAYTTMSNRKTVIYTDTVNAVAGASSSYFAALSVGDEHPTRSALIGGFFGLGFGRFRVASRNNAAKMGALSAGASNSLNQGINLYDGKKIKVSEIILSTYLGGFGAMATYGMPIFTGAILRFGPETALNKIGDECLGKWFDY